MAVFLEGVESITLACTLVILLPTVALAATSRSFRPAVVAGAAGGTALMMWARAGRLWEFDASGTTAWLIAGAIVAAFAGVAVASRWSLAAALLGGAVAGWLWQPCVGQHFADVLSRAESERIESLALLQLYVVGALLPAVLLTALPYAVPRLAPAFNHNRVRLTGMVLGAAYAMSVAAGWYTDLVGELFRISS